MFTLLATTLAFAVPDAPFAKDENTTLLAHFDGPGADADFAAGEPKRHTAEDCFDLPRDPAA